MFDAVFFELLHLAWSHVKLPTVPANKQQWDETSEKQEWSCDLFDSTYNYREIYNVWRGIINKGL